MADRPIIFNDHSVREIIAGRKTVTRRVGKTWAKARPGDLLWVREAWNIGTWEGGEGPRSWFGVAWPIPADLGDNEVIYRANDEIPALADPPPWRPSIHMPRWASRLTLRVVSIERQYAYLLAPRLPDLDDLEAAKEGFDSRDAFMRAWLDMHGGYTGPVWRVEFAAVPGAVSLPLETQS